MPHRSILFSVIGIGILTGVFTRSVFVVAEVFIMFTAAIGFIAMLPWRWRSVRVAGLFVIAVAGGALYFVVREPAINQTTLQWYAGQTVTIHGTISAEIDRRKDHQKLVVESYSVEIGSDNYPVRGKLTAKVPLYPGYQYRDELRLRCKLERPQPIEDFAYDKYLALSGVHTVCLRPKVEVVGSNSISNVVSIIYALKDHIIVRLNELYHEPQASFMAGLLIGARRGMPDSLLEDFQRTGVTHIIAISGYNITIIASIILSATQRWIGRKRAFWLVLAALTVFAVITGAQASVVRATVMGVIVLLARQSGRLSSVGVSLILAALLMAVVQPLVLAYDAGFQLSFLATVGLVYLSPRLERSVKRIPEFFGLRETIVATVSATIMTLPLITWQFGRVSVVALAANLLILPLIPTIMGIGFLSLVASVFWWPAGFGISLVSSSMLEYVVFVTEFFSRFSFASFEVTKFSVWIVIASYAALSWFLIRTNPTQRNSHLCPPVSKKQ
ncbi:MAG: ComEC/Rec2 family competence protein [bacterium]|nr:ComEC/Rec2 family competence protein [bacterium]